MQHVIHGIPAICAMIATVYPALQSTIHFNTPDHLSCAFPYRLHVAGQRSCDRSHAPIGARFNHHTLVYTYSGAGMVRMGRASAAAHAGSIAWVDTSQSYQHACHPEAESWSYLWMGLEGHGLDMVFARLRVASNPVFTSQETVAAEAHFHRVVELIRGKSPAIGSACNAIAAQLIAIIAGACADTMAGRNLPSRLAAVMQAVRTDPARRWSVDDLADIAQVSASQLFRQFRRHVGMTPLDWVRHERIDLAKQLLSGTDMPVAAVALYCGYPDPFHFSREFRRLTNIAPSGFRMEKM